MLEPDVGQVPISLIEGLGAELGQLAQMHSSAVKDGRRIDAAVLEVKYAEKFAAWCAMQRIAAADDIVSLEASRRALALRINWWRELNYLDAEPSELSSAQKSIFEGAELIPRDWRHANEVLSLLPEFAAPQCGTFDSWNASFMKIEAVIKLLLEYLRKALSQFDVTDPKDPTWHEFRDETHPDLVELVELLEKAWATAEFSQ